MGRLYTHLFLGMGSAIGIVLAAWSPKLARRRERHATIAVVFLLAGLGLITACRLHHDLWRPGRLDLQATDLRPIRIPASAVTTAMTRSRPPQLAHSRTSTEKQRRRSMGHATLGVVARRSPSSSRFQCFTESTLGERKSADAPARDVVALALFGARGRSEYEEAIGFSFWSHSSARGRRSRPLVVGGCGTTSFLHEDFGASTP